MGRVNEINRPEWNDMDLEHRRIILYTRKKRGGHLTCIRPETLKLKR